MIRWKVIRLAPPLLAGAFLLTGGPGVHAAEPPASTRSVFDGDGALERRVTLDEHRIYLGELLDRLSEATGARLSASDRVAPISGFRLTVVVRDRPARDVLEALARLYSAPPDRWTWEVQRVAPGGSGKNSQEVAPGRRYVLRSTVPPEEAAGRAERETQEALWSLYQARRAFYALSPEQQHAAAARDPDLRRAADPRAEGAFRLLEPFPDQDVRAIIAGQPREVPLQRLSPRGRAFAEQYFHASGAGGELPRHVSLRRADFVGAAILFQVGDAGGGAVLNAGFLEQAAREQARAAWAAESERKPPDGQVPAENGGAGPRGKAPDGRGPRDEILQRLARAGQINLLFDDAGWSNLAVQVPGGLSGPLPDVLTRLERARLLWKRSGNFLLFRDDRFGRGYRAAAVPWPVLRTLHRRADSRDGYLSSDDWLLLAGLTRAQLDTLSDEFPDAGRVKQFQIPLRLAASLTEKERASLASPRGTGWEDWSPATRRRVLTLFSPEEARRARLFLEWSDDTRPPRMRLYLDTEARIPVPLVIEFQKRKTRPDPVRQPSLLEQLRQQRGEPADP